MATRAARIPAFAKCRNERLRLPAFLRHYRALGVDEFFIADNESTDGSAEYLLDQPDVHVFPTAGPFREAKGGTDWLNALLAEFGVGCWCVTVDIDELLVFPGSEHASLRQLTAYLDENGSQALSCLLLDLYPSWPLCASRYEAGGDLLAAAPFFDAYGYARRRVETCPGVHITGGVRERIFYPERRASGFRGALTRAFGRSRPPCLTKVPLVRWDDGTRYLYSNHWVSQKQVAPETGVLLHFKLLHDFQERALREAARGEYYDDSSEYRRYAEKLAADPDLTVMGAPSTRFESTSQIVRLGLMRSTPEWAQRVIGTT